ncbi:MAG: hypothetical protein WCG25_04310 [bacterium]
MFSPRVPDNASITMFDVKNEAIVGKANAHNVQDISAIQYLLIRSLILFFMVSDLYIS